MKKKYKEYMESKKIRLLLTLVLLLLVTIGSTYAWWTASTQLEQKVIMGNLKIEAKLNPQTHTNYEPGTYTEIKGVIKNIGSIPAMIKIENDSKITFAYSDDNLTLIEESNRIAENVDPAAIQVDYEPQSGNYIENSKIFWFTDSTGNKYLLMEPKTSLKVSIMVHFDGEKTTNRYMDSVVDAKAKIRATQVIEGAITSEFGIDPADLISLPTTRAVEFGQKRLQELLARE